MIRHWLRIGFVVMVHPSLWATAIRQLRRMAPPGWWRRMPFLPVPSGDYLNFRLATQYGSTGQTRDRVPDPVDVLTYLAWCRRVEP